MCFNKINIICTSNVTLSKTFCNGGTKRWNSLKQTAAYVNIMRLLASVSGRLSDKVLCIETCVMYRKV